MGSKWSTVSITGYKASSPSDDGQSTEANKVKYSTIYTNLTDPLNVASTAVIAKLDELFTDATVAVSTNYTTVASDHTKWLEVTGTVTITLLAAATATAGYRVGVKNVGTGLVTVARSAADTIDGATSLAIGPSGAIPFVVNAAVDGYTHTHTDNLLAQTLAIGYGVLDPASDGDISHVVECDTVGVDLGSNWDTTVGRGFYIVPFDGIYQTAIFATFAGGISDGGRVRALCRVDSTGMNPASPVWAEATGEAYSQGVHSENFNGFSVANVRSVYSVLQPFTAGTLVAAGGALTAWSGADGELRASLSIHCVKRT